MSTKPNPVAETSAMLMKRKCFQYPSSDQPFDHWIHNVADIASRLHRLAKGCERASVAQCNGEMWDGQRDQIHRLEIEHKKNTLLADVEVSVEKYCARIDKQVDKLAQELAPFKLTCKRNGDPRGYCLKLYTTDPTRPVPHNHMGGDSWGIE